MGVNVQVHFKQEDADRVSIRIYDFQQNKDRLKERAAEDKDVALLYWIVDFIYRELMGPFVRTSDEVAAIKAQGEISGN